MDNSYNLESNECQNPKGVLLIIGGAEDKGKETGNGKKTSKPQ